MKIDRLLDIVIYLLNHKTATAKQLSERFQVSVRTIQRDVESIALAVTGRSAFYRCSSVVPG